MDDWFKLIRTGHNFSTHDAKELLDRGFVMIPGPVATERLSRFSAAYDAAMSSANTADIKVGSTTVRVSDFVNRGSEFDDLYIFPPLLEASHHIIGAPFKLSSSFGRTLQPRSVAQDIHIDIKRDSEDLPMAGFILMIDEFRADNGATRFVPGSHFWSEVPEQVIENRQADCAGEVLACGPAGSMIIFNGAVWHGHTANVTDAPRRSIQGYFVRREARSGIDWSARMLPETLARIVPLARYLLAI